MYENFHQVNITRAVMIMYNLKIKVSLHNPNLVENSLFNFDYLGSILRHTGNHIVYLILNIVMSCTVNNSVT